VSEFRQDPITGRWTIVAEGRSARPNEYTAPPPSSPPGECPFCEGHESWTPPELAAYRGPNGRRDGPGWTVRTIPNKFPTLAPSGSTAPNEPGERANVRKPGFGFHEVVIESPDHASFLPLLPRERVREVVRMLGERVRSLASTPGVAAVVLFENFGPESGGTLVHPHAQLVGLPEVPPMLTEEAQGAVRFTRSRGGSCAFESVLADEREAAVRVVSDGADLTAYAPFASEHPFEVRIVPRRHTASLGHASDAELDQLAEVLPAVLGALRAVVPGASYNFVARSFADGRPEGAGYHWHLDILPRLIRPDGFEVGGGIAVNPVPPESAAAQLRAALDRGSRPGPPPDRGQ
jgi:UDPglucose--hexose-1-phosphate uridylyltransferase